MATERREWWQEFFSNAAWQDVQLAVNLEETREECDRIERLLEMGPGSSVLDIPCGEGRHALEFARRGHVVTGVDITARFLETARERAKRDGFTVRFQHGDMREIEFEEEFDVALSMWGSFGYFDDEGNMEYLRCVAKALKPGGRFLIDTHIAETIYRIFEPRGWSRRGDMVLLEERLLNFETGRIETEWTYINESGMVDKTQSSMRMYTYRELKEMVLEAGFSGFEGFDMKRGGAFRIGSFRIAAVATK